MTTETLSTDEFAAALGIKSATVRVRLCRTGSYYGIRPTKLPNRFLRWPADGPQRLMGGHDASDAVRPVAE